MLTHGQKVTLTVEQFLYLTVSHSATEHLVQNHTVTTVIEYKGLAITPDGIRDRFKVTTTHNGAEVSGHVDLELSP